MSRERQGWCVDVRWHNSDKQIICVSSHGHAVATRRSSAYPCASSKSQEVASELLRLLGTAALPVDARALAMAALRAGMRAARDVPAVLRAACRAWRDAPTDGSAPHAAALLAAAAEAFGPPETWTAAQAVGWAAAVAEEGVWASLSAAPRQSP